MTSGTVLKRQGTGNDKKEKRRKGKRRKKGKKEGGKEKINEVK